MYKKRTLEQVENLDEQFQPRSKISKSSPSNLQQGDEHPTVLVLIDFYHDSCQEQMTWLKEAFSLTFRFWQDMFKKYDYIPIEYSKNLYFLTRFFTTHNYYVHNHALSPDIQSAVTTLFRKSPVLESSKLVKDEIDYDLVLKDSRPNVVKKKLKIISKMTALQLVCHDATNYFSLPNRFTSDGDIVREVVRQYPRSVRFLPSNFFKIGNRKVVLKILEECPKYLVGCKQFFDSLAKSFSNDMEIMYLAAILSPSILGLVSDELCQNEEFFMQVLIANPYAFRHSPLHIRTNMKIINHVVKQDIELFKYVGKEVKISPGRVLQIVQTNGNVLQYLQSYESIINNHEIVTEAAKNNASAIQFASKRLQSNLNFMKTIVQLNVGTLRYVLPSLIDNPYFISKAEEKGFSFIFSQHFFEKRSKQLFGPRISSFLDNTTLINKMAERGTLPTSWYIEQEE